jgi:hypothetical protein
MIDRVSFPRLDPVNHKVISPATIEYNCVAWAVGVTDCWWQPGVSWPIAVSPGDYGIAVLEQLFIALGFEECLDERLEVGYEKVALYGNSMYYTHVAKQLRSGKWTSKLGKLSDIEHDTPHDVAGGVYGEVVQFMRRPIRLTTPGATGSASAS